MVAPISEMDTRQRDHVFNYRLYGLNVRSDIRLPMPIDCSVRDQVPDVVIECASPGQPIPVPNGPLVSEQRCDLPCHDGDPVFQIHRGSGGAWLWNARVGTCHVSPDHRRVDVYPEPGVDERHLGLVLFGQVTIFILHSLGYPCLHASAVVTKHGAAAFVGQKGQGKSTMTAAFLHHGEQLLTDDLLPLQEVMGEIEGIPGPPMMKVWPATAQHTLGISDDLPDLMPGTDKKLLVLSKRFRWAQVSTPLRAIYVLERYEPRLSEKNLCSIRRLNGREGLVTLLAQTPAGTRYIRAEEMARLLPIYTRLVAQAEVRVLRYPNGFEHQQNVCAQILDDLERR